MLLTGNKQMHTWGLDPNTLDAPWRKLGSKPTSVQGSRTPQCHHVSKHSQAPATAEHRLLAVPCPSDLLLLLGVQTAPALHKPWARGARRQQRPQRRTAKSRAATHSRAVKEGEVNKTIVLCLGFVILRLGAHPPKHPLKTTAFMRPVRCTARSQPSAGTAWRDMSYQERQGAQRASVPSACPSHSSKKQQHCWCKREDNAL